MSVLGRLGDALRFTPRHWYGRRVRREQLQPGAVGASVLWPFDMRPSPRPNLPLARRFNALKAQAKDTRHGAVLLHEHASIRLADFKEGAEAAYRFVAEQLHACPGAAGRAQADGEASDLLRHDVTSPRLGSFLNDVRASWAARGSAFEHQLASVDSVVVCSVRVREGAAQKPRQILGVWDRAEVLNQLTDGGAWEDRWKLDRAGRAARRLRGPCRLVADVRLVVRERVRERATVAAVEGRAACPLGAACAEQPEPRVQLLQLERDVVPAVGARAEAGEALSASAVAAMGWDVAPRWRVCNVNDAIDPCAWLPKPYEE
eukprot:g2503.t1